MSLDVYVMPIWCFKADDFSTSTRRFRSRLSVPSGRWSDKLASIQDKISNRVRVLRARGDARKQVRTIIDEAEGQLGIRPEWRDQGKVVLSEQASFGFETLRAYSMWLDLKDHFLTFDDPPDGNFYNHPVWSWKEDQASKFRFSHLVDHSCYSGYYVPCRFDRIVEVDKYRLHGSDKFRFKRSFGSSYQLQSTLSRLEEGVQDNAMITVSESTRWAIREGFVALQGLCAASLEYRLPIVFFG